MSGKKGFTFIEVVIFCFIAITLLTLVIGLGFNSREFARTIGCVNNMKNIAQAVENFQADHKTTPSSIADLYPAYIESEKALVCPSDRKSNGNSYDAFYIGRFIDEGDANKIFLACPRHHRRSKTVAAYLSYAVDIGRSQKVQWSGTNAEFGEVYSGGELSFADGTTVQINSGKVGLLSSFVDNENKIYGIVYTLDGAESTLTVTHEGESKFEIITPAVIAGVEGTKFAVRNWLTENKIQSYVSVSDGAVAVEDRSMDVKASVVQPNQVFSVAVPVALEDADSVKIRNRVPRKPSRRK
ncbi:MAG: FecR domain-containing protein [Candidatus Omnitrophica bacterium]|nr:FecR domain-containing protein [Candidatus Omnitrophota bacterium]